MIEYNGDDGEVYKKKITAYFSEKIKTNQGPNFLFGLPGLILEANIGRLKITCYEIELYNEKKPLKIPSNGELVNNNQFKMIVQNKIESRNKN